MRTATRMVKGRDQVTNGEDTMRRVRSFPIFAAGFAVLLVALFAACGGGGGDEPTPMIGTYAFTSITCGDGSPGPSWLTDRIVGGRTWEVSTTDGHDSRPPDVAPAKSA